MTHVFHRSLAVCLGLGLLTMPLHAVAQLRPRTQQSTAQPNTTQPNTPAARTEAAPAATSAAGSATAGEAQPATSVFAPATPGVCLFSRAAAIGGSKAGLAATVRMQQLANEVSAELNSQRQGIGSGTDGAASVQQRAINFSQIEQIRNIQLQRTKLLVEQQIAQAIGPLMEPIIAKRACSVLIERGNAYGWNPAMDITPQVIQDLDQKLPSVQVVLVPPTAVTQ